MVSYGVTQSSANVCLRGLFSLCWCLPYYHMHTPTHIYTHVRDTSAPACQGSAPAAAVLMMLRGTHAAPVTTAPILCPVCVREVSSRANCMTDGGPIDCSQSSGLPAKIGPPAKSSSAQLICHQAGQSRLHKLHRPAELARCVLKPVLPRPTVH